MVRRDLGADRPRADACGNRALDEITRATRGIERRLGPLNGSRRRCRNGSRAYVIAQAEEWFGASQTSSFVTAESRPAPVQRGGDLRGGWN